MEKDKVIEISNDVENKSNRDLFSAVDTLIEEFENTKQLIIDLTRHLDTVRELHDKINNEIEKRKSK